ncbi:MAG: signal recognition particle-docking protein FtsY [Candidatus Auribacter fodinae]|jgi:fused signal recognition particle receptor|uniref:Signal recognition particle receptor FtsY n=1 Tax=Candidatus Auribacter fodinae TaxID=2093366 RepID=A0A3A4R6J7_9BACT|nr:MAG: signal recognition particle-docking protein FtsY [Candidatus Auribacter fodinae]
MVVKKITAGLKKTRDSFSAALRTLFRGEISSDMYEDIEEILVQTDMGIDTVMKLVGNIENRLSRSSKKDSAVVVDAIKTELLAMMNQTDNTLRTASSPVPTVIMLVGVNGTGKTTSVAKMANHLLKQKKKVMLAACDTFRGAAIEQLDIWAQRTGTYLVKHQHGADAAAVAYDACQAAIARNVDYLLIDTAGRLHTNKNLMEELKKIKRTVQKLIPEAPHEILITIDAVSGQNALPQVQIFNDQLSLTGMILTKLDGTAKGGIVIKIQHEISLPVKFIGVGEGMDDLLPFSNQEFVNALFEE